MKLLEKYSSGMSPHKLIFALNSLHSLAFSWGFEDGLWCHHPKYQIASFLFSDLYSQRGNGVYTMITKSTRIHISKDLPKNKKDVFRSKYLHISYITKMASHQGVGFFEIHAHSGNSLGTNQ